MYSAKGTIPYGASPRFGYGHPWGMCTILPVDNNTHEWGFNESAYSIAELPYIMGDKAIYPSKNKA